MASDEEEFTLYDEELDGEELIPLNDESAPHEEEFRYLKTVGKIYATKKK